MEPARRHLRLQGLGAAAAAGGAGAALAAAALGAWRRHRLRVVFAVVDGERLPVQRVRAEKGLADERV